MADLEAGGERAVRGVGVDSPGIAKMSVRHEAIMNYMIANPVLKLRDVAGTFGVSQAWLSTIIYSDAFQERLSEKKEQVFDSSVLQPLKTKLLAVANDTIEKLHDQIATTSDIRELTNTADKVLSRLGFGTGPVTAAVSQTFNYVQNNVTAGTDVIERARAMIGRVKSQDLAALANVSEGKFDLAPAVFSKECANGESTDDANCGGDSGRGPDSLSSVYVDEGARGSKAAGREV